MKKISLVLFIVVISGLISPKIAEASIFSDLVSSLKDLQVRLTELVTITKNISSDDTSLCQTKNCPPVKLNEINIPELGVKLSVPNSIKDLKYLVATTSLPAGQAGATSTSKTVLLSSETLNNLDDNCALTPAPMGTLSLARNYASTTFATSTVTATSSMKAGEIRVYAVGNKQIVYQNPQTYCSDNKLVQGLLAKQLKSLQDSLKTLTLLSAASSTPATASSTESTTIDLSASIILSQPATSTASTTGQ